MTYLRDVVIPRRERILRLTQLEYNAMLRGVFQLIEARQDLAARAARGSHRHSRLLDGAHGARHRRCSASAASRSAGRPREGDCGRPPATKPDE